MLRKLGELIVAVVLGGIKGFILGAIIALLIGLSFWLFNSCSDGETPETPPVTEPFCEKIERTEIDFSVLNDVIGYINYYSAFKINTSNELLLTGAMERVFGFLAVPKEEIPQWARDIVDREIERANEFKQVPDFSVLNQIFVRLSEDPRYQDLKEPTQIENLLETSINGIMKTLGDPFSNYMSAELWKSGAASNTGKYQGLGITLRKNERGEIAIDSVFPGDPAERASLKPGDAILEVDGKSVNNCNIRQFILKLKTRENPEIIFKIRRYLTGEEEEIKIVMEEIKVTAISSCPYIELPNGRGDTSKGLPYNCPVKDADGNPVENILYIKIKEFTAQAAEDLRTVLESVDMTQFEGVIVDVRENPGGRVDTVLSMVDYFLEDLDPIMIMEYADGHTVIQKSDLVDLVPPEIPVVIIMGKDSYSGAEAFSGALRDNGRAILISKDERTGGKGTFNNYFLLKNGDYGALYIAIGMWLTPNREFIERQDLDNDGYFEVGGLKPDVKVDWTDEDYIENGRNPDYDPTLFEAINWIRSQIK